MSSRKRKTELPSGGAPSSAKKILAQVKGKSKTALAIEKARLKRKKENVLEEYASPTKRVNSRTLHSNKDALYGSSPKQTKQTKRKSAIQIAMERARNRSSVHVEPTVPSPKPESTLRRRVAATDAKQSPSPKQQTPKSSRSSRRKQSTPIILEDSSSDEDIPNLNFDDATPTKKSAQSPVHQTLEYEENVESKTKKIDTPVVTKKETPVDSMEKKEEEQQSSKESSFKWTSVFKWGLGMAILVFFIMILIGEELEQDLSQLALPEYAHETVNSMVLLDAEESDKDTNIPKIVESYLDKASPDRKDILLQMTLSEFKLAIESIRNAQHPMYIGAGICFGFAVGGFVGVARQLV